MIILTECIVEVFWLQCGSTFYIIENSKEQRLAVHTDKPLSSTIRHRSWPNLNPHWVCHICSPPHKTDWPKRRKPQARSRSNRRTIDRSMEQAACFRKVKTKYQWEMLITLCLGIYQNWSFVSHLPWRASVAKCKVMQCEVVNRQTVSRSVTMKL